MIVFLQIRPLPADGIDVGGDCVTPGAQCAIALLRAGLRRRHVEATLVRELGLSPDDASAVVADVLAHMPKAS